MPGTHASRRSLPLETAVEAKSMPGKDELDPAAVQRAARLRQQIDEMKRSGQKKSPDAPESPREFTERRKRELDDEQ
jgi:hypothetical protein